MRQLLSSRWRWTDTPRTIRRCYSSGVLQTSLQAPFQQYVSQTTDPYLNLSIEHHLLQKSSPNSVILFQYVNRPSVIIGRNQNPWVEVNLPLLKSDLIDGVGEIDLVRRRSGGGTVFHDHGNVNWSIISPPAAFTRDKHAEMVVRALRSCGIDQARVNQRHDIVMDQGSRPSETVNDDLHSTAYRDNGSIKSLKVSGSAYKLTKHRALHHGTCLLSSPNIGGIGRFLRSPLKPFIEAKGVESVSSPIANIGLENTDFMDAVRVEFQALYQAGSGSVVLNDDCAEMSEIRDGLAELKSREWTFLQTPQFTLRVADNEFSSELEMNVRYGVIAEAKTRGSKDAPWQHSHDLNGQIFHEIADWQQVLAPVGWSNVADQERVVAWLERYLPQPK